MALEYVPFDAYGLLRRIVGKGPQRVRRDSVGEDEPARYLVSRNLAREINDHHIESTEAGKQIGLIDHQP